MPLSSRTAATNSRFLLWGDNTPTSPRSSSTEEAARAASVAVLPVGSFEQHGSHLPLSTDTLIANAIARRVQRTTNCSYCRRSQSVARKNASAYSTSL
jgi:hypothetical protein